MLSTILIYALFGLAVLVLLSIALLPISLAVSAWIAATAKRDRERLAETEALLAECEELQAELRQIEARMHRTST